MSVPSTLILVVNDVIVELWYITTHHTPAELRVCTSMIFTYTQSNTL